jgi:hypothetical protein
VIRVVLLLPPQPQLSRRIGRRFLRPTSKTLSAAAKLLRRLVHRTCKKRRITSWRNGPLIGTPTARYDKGVERAVEVHERENKVLNEQLRNLRCLGEIAEIPLRNELGG